MTWNAALRSSEFWAGIVLALLGVFVKSGLIPADAVAAAEPYVKAVIVYIVARLTSKTAKAAVPPNGPIKLAPVATLLALLALLVAFWAIPVHAAPVVKVAAGVNGVWLNGPAADFTKDFEGAVVASASLSPHLSAVGHAFYGFSGNYVRYDGGARVTATDVDNPNFNLYLGILYRNGSTDAVRPGEWAPDAGVGWKPNPKGWPHLVLGADAAYGLDSERLVSYAAVRWQF